MECVYILRKTALNSENPGTQAFSESINIRFASLICNRIAFIHYGSYLANLNNRINAISIQLNDD